MTIVPDQEPIIMSLSVMYNMMYNIKHNGLQSPIHVTSKGIILDGHLRYWACKLLDWKQIPILIVYKNGKTRLSRAYI